MKAKLAVILLHLAINGTDAYFTNRNANRPRFYETNPVAAPFVTHGTGLRVAFFATATAIEIGGTYEIRKHGHAKLAAAWEVGTIASHAWGTGTSIAKGRQ